MWNPPSGIRHDPTRRAFAASYDAYLSASPSVTQFIAELSVGAAGPPKPIADFRFFPSSPRRVAQASSYDSLSYLGVHWDGARHGGLLDELVSDGLISLYGPPSAWRHAGQAYRGQIPFDGVSVIKRLAEHGIALCLHREPHLNEDTPSMRLFEAASAGCLILADSIPFARATFGDSIFVLPDGEERADFVRETVAWARANPGRARDMGRRSQEIFEQRCSLDVLLPKIVTFGRAIAMRAAARPRAALLPWTTDRVDVFCVLADADDDAVDRLVATVDAQTHRRIRLVLVRAGGARATAARVRPRPGIKVFTIAPDGDPQRLGESLARHAASHFVACLRPGTEWAPNHLATLVVALRGAPDTGTAHAGRVLIARSGPPISAPNFSGDLRGDVEENRLLDRKGFADNAGPFGVADAGEILTRCDWLMTRSVFQRVVEAQENGIGVAVTTRHTGYVTAFSNALSTETFDPIVFV